jgi:hypothetical protein
MKSENQNWVFDVFKIYILYFFGIYIYRYWIEKCVFFRTWSEITLINCQDDARKYWKNEEIIFYKKELGLSK